MKSDPSIALIGKSDEPEAGGIFQPAPAVSGLNGLDGMPRQAQHEAMVEIRTKRIYDPPSPEDGVRVLVDRLWPRGIKKEEAALDDWLRDAAPSTELRKWFGHDPERWDGFRRRYMAELTAARVSDLFRSRMARGRLTLLYSAKDEAHNQAIVLADYLRQHVAK
jgi:uncharacterized protein YeaO (DUF488 family)